MKKMRMILRRGEERTWKGKMREGGSGGREDDTTAEDDDEEEEDEEDVDEEL